jgi:hypothetical protein
VDSGSRGVEGTEIVDKRAWHAALPLVDFQGLARSVLLREWQGRWDAADTCRFTHSILPKVSLRPWFEGQRKDRKFVSTLSRIGLLKDRFRIVERFETDRRRLTCTRYAAWDSCP